MALSKVKNTGVAGLDIDSSNIVDMPSTVMYDTYRLTTNVTSNSTITAWEKPDDALAVTVGDSMSVSSGIFTFPRTGVYKVSFFATIENNGGDNVTSVDLEGTTDNSTYDLLVYVVEGDTDSSPSAYGSVYGEAVVNISDTSNRKVRLKAGSVGSGSHIRGHTDYNTTYICFQYLAPAQ